MWVLNHWSLALQSGTLALSHRNLKILAKKTSVYKPPSIFMGNWGEKKGKIKEWKKDGPFFCLKGCILYQPREKRGLKEDTGKPKERLRLRAIPSFQGRYFSLYLLKPGISKQFRVLYWSFNRDARKNLCIEVLLCLDDFDNHGKQIFKNCSFSIYLLLKASLIWLGWKRDI